MTRRDLLAAAVLPLRLPRKIRLGMAGFEGHTAEILDPLPRLPDVELAAIVDDANVSNLQAKRYATLGEMLAAERLDIVALCGPNDRRAAEILACAAKRVHIVAEKPLALSTRDLDRVERAVRASGVRLTMLLPMRFEPEYLALREIVASGAIGEVVQIHSQKSYQVGSRPAWQLKRESFGGTIPFIGIHMVDLMRWSSGREFKDVTSIHAHIGSPESGEMENTTGSLFRLDNGGAAVMHLDYLRPAAASSHGDDRLRLVGTQGIAEYQEATGVTLMTASKPLHRIEKLPAKQSLFADFLDSIYNGKPASLTIEDIWRVNRIVLAGRESAERRKTIAL